MPSPTRIPWPAWAKFLRRYGLENLAAWLLEAGGPLNVLGAQALFLGSPLLQPLLNGDKIDALANLLEDHDEGQAFIEYLRESAA
ncbi:MAG: hypothetical protein FJZ96_01365 [Chloroflexi bacterium]|nr:hypothetical protein [Chloroflexota bacterium]